MNWKIKALVQNLVATLPRGPGDRLYYSLQRNLGVLRDDNPRFALARGAAFLSHLESQDISAESKVFLEMGTGRRLALPMALWLGGAARVLSVDVNRYLKPEIVLGDLAYIRQKREDFERIFRPHSLEASFRSRLESLVEFDPARRGFPALLELLGVEYLAPMDVTALPLASGSVDCHLSFNVLEHVPPETLKATLLDARRLLKPGGFFLHHIGPSDHFCRSDASISAINFLKYSDRAWGRIAGNRFMYINRLRIDDFEELFREAGLEPLTIDRTVDRQSLDELKAGFKLDERFSSKSDQVNATVVAWVFAR